MRNHLTKIVRELEAKGWRVRDGGWPQGIGRRASLGSHDHECGVMPSPAVDDSRALNHCDPVPDSPLRRVKLFKNKKNIKS
jgi:hypothetical protein